MTIGPGDHRLAFQAADPVIPADRGDQRVLSFAIGPWTWMAQSEAPRAPPNPASHLTAEAR